MAVQPDLSRLINSSPHSFNTAKRALQQKGLLPVIRDVKVKRDLREHDLSNLFFFECTFENAKFGNLRDCTFSNCPFIYCDFSPSYSTENSNDSLGLVNLTFFECCFDGTKFDRQRMRDFRIVDPVIIVSPTFSRSFIDGTFVYDDKVINPTVLQKLINAETSPEARVLIIGHMFSSFVNWERIRVLAKLPFLQVSLLGVSLLSIASVIVASFGEPFQFLLPSCEKILESDFTSAQIFLRVCLETANLSIGIGLLSSLRFMFIGFLFVFLGALIQVTKCPEEILEFSRAFWVRQLRRPTEFYSTLSYQKSIWIVSAAVFQFLGIGLVVFKTVKSFLNVFIN